MRLKKIFDWIVKKLYPPRCIFCMRIMEDSAKLCVCRKCFGEIERIPPQRCPVCGRVTVLGNSVCWRCSSQKIPYSLHRSVYFYEGAVRRSIIRLKFQNKPQYADTMGRIISVYIPHGKTFDAVAYVPMTQKAEKKRGYNQSQLIAEGLSEASGLKTCELLVKVRETKKQSTLNFEKRQKNIKGAFKTTGDVRGKRIILVDDVFTTGATMCECASVLKRAGAAEVVCLSFAMTKEKQS